MKIKEAIARGDVVTGEEPFNFFLAVLFPSDQLLCMEYNRVVRDLAGFSVSLSCGVHVSFRSTYRSCYVVV